MFIKSFHIIFALLWPSLAVEVVVVIASVSRAMVRTAACTRELEVGAETALLLQSLGEHLIFADVIVRD
jgi:hypothetical protein